MPGNQKKIEKVDIIVRVDKDGDIQISARARLESERGARPDKYIHSHIPTEEEKGAMKSIVRALAQTLGAKEPEWIKGD